MSFGFSQKEPDFRWAVAGHRIDLLPGADLALFRQSRPPMLNDT